MNKKLSFLIGLMLLSLFIGVGAVSAATSKAKNSNTANQAKCQESMRSSYNNSYNSLVKSVTKVNESVTSLSAIGVKISTTTTQMLAGMSARMNTLNDNRASLLETSDANGADCLKGTGEVHTKAVAVKAEIASIKDDLNYITNSVRSLNNALKGVTRFEKYAQSQDKYYANMSQKISSGGDKVTQEIKNTQAAWLQKIQEYKTDITALKNMIADLYAADNHSELGKIKLSL